MSPGGKGNLKNVKLFFSLLILSACFLRSAGAPDWPVFRGSPSLTGVTDAALPSKLKLRWSYQAKESIESSAAIVSGVVYFGSMDGSLHAVDLSTGKARWTYATGGPVQESSPCVHNGIVYIGDLNGVFHAVDAATGKPRWTFKSESEIKSSPNCSGDRVYFGSYDQNLYCLSARTGELVWKYATEGPVHCTPSMAKGRVYISGCDETFRAIDAASGKQAFEIQLGAYTGGSTAIDGAYGYVGTFGNEVLAIDLERRGIQWTYRHAARSFPFYSSAAVTASRVVLGGRDKLVHCLEKATGKELWTFTTKARVESSPLATGNRVFVGSNDGLLYELDLVSGRKMWEFTAGAPLSASPAAAQGALVIGSQDGIMYCFGD
ncbi:MAG: Pyrrolo-quinoline quinone repeat-containing protein [Acidobacteria bacterium]|nr:Pyrrolo-quinoline quinone repeat-containing protein [Acidobacteriota bacterium]